MTLSEINSGSREQFVDAIGWVFEHSPWVAERAWPHRPFATVEELHAAMVMELEKASIDEQLRLLRAHPDLGARVSMTSASRTEQAGAGLHNLTRDELDLLTRLNTAYRDKFGFPFLYAVKGSTKQDILQVLETRLESSPSDELREALRQSARIARFRLEATVKEKERP